MNENISIAIYLVLAFLGSAGAAYLLARAPRKKMPTRLSPGQVVRFVSPSGVYRSRFLGKKEDALRFTAPLKNDAYVPLRRGEMLLVEAGVQGGAQLFHTQVIDRDASTREILVALPENFKVVERRTERRSLVMNGRQACLNQEFAEIVDLSASGARLITTFQPASGDIVRLKVPGVLEDEMAWVLEVLPDSLDAKPASQVRLLFARG